MVRNKRKTLIASINMVPFIDIVLVILIVFMLVTPLVVSNHVRVDLPRVSSQSTEQTQSNQWVLTINKEGIMFLDRGTGSRSAANTPLELEDINFIIRTGLQSFPDLAVFIRADRSLSYGEVVETMAKIQESGLSNVGLITENP